MGGGGGSSSKRKSKKKSIKTSSLKKKERKEPKRSRRAYDSDSDDESLTSSSPSRSDHRMKKNRVKKLRREGSVSSHSDHQSVSSDSDSLSNHDNSRKSRKARRSRIALKSSKKRKRKRHASPSKDSKSRNVRKRKRLGRDSSVRPRKKSSKKKSKKHFSSLLSSDSESCSTCQSSSSSSSADVKRKRVRRATDKEVERLRGRETYKGDRKRKERSLSRSSYDRGSDYNSIDDSKIDEESAPVNNYRRLRSVIIVVNKSHDEGEYRIEKDPQKEEIVYDYDDYPSPKSQDSDEGGSRRDSDNLSHGVFGKRTSVANVGDEGVTETGKSGSDKTHRDNSVDHLSDGEHMNNKEKEKETDVSVSVPVAASGGDDLESILRQKALENLMKFRGGRQTGPRSTANLKMSNETDVNRSSSGRVNFVQKESVEKGDSNAREMNQRSGPSFETDEPRLTEVKKGLKSGHVEQDHEIAKPTISHPSDGTFLLGFSEQDKRTISDAVFSEPLPGNGTSPGAEVTNARNSSTVGATSGTELEEHILEERENEDKDGSQYEQKTMSVMKGGEMVQVSYKVYIPKRAQALARRQLRR